MSIRERREILRLANGREASEKKGALITLVRASGSTYRRPGARLLITSEGQFAGTISGGCLEADLLRKAAWKTRDGALMEHFSTAFDDTADIPYGLGCGGEVDLLLEPAHTPEAEALLAAMQQSIAGETLLVATTLPEAENIFGRIIVAADGPQAGNVIFASHHIPTDDVVDLRAYLRKNHTASETPEAEAHRTYFFERLAPPQRLLIFGAGEDARPLAHLAAHLGWQVEVADRRPQHARAERFPGAHAVHAHADLDRLHIAAQDAVVLMTHSYEEDRRLLAHMLQIQPRYLGLLGARHRSSLLLHETAPALNLTLAEACSRLHAPIGLDLGGDGPHAVSIAVIAEIQAALHNRAAAQRGMTAEEVEQQLREKGTLPRICALDLQP